MGIKSKKQPRKITLTFTVSVDRKHFNRFLNGMVKGNKVSVDTAFKGKKYHVFEVSEERCIENAGFGLTGGAHKIYTGNDSGTITLIEA